jgi:hypothetical protein
MTVKIRYLNKKGDEIKEVPLEEALNMIDAEEGKYYIVDSETRKLIKPIEIADGQSLMLLPAVGGG